MYFVIYIIGKRTEETYKKNKDIYNSREEKRGKI